MSDGSNYPIVCAGCQKAYPWQEKYAGKRAKCRCGTVISFPASPPVKPVKPAAAKPLRRAVAAAPEEPETQTCPSCKGTMPSGAMLCIQCGYNVQTGSKMGGVSPPASRRGAVVTERREESATVQTAKRLGLALVVGGVTAVACGALWAWIGILTGYEIGYVAWGIGALVGVVVAKFAQDQSAMVGLGAVGVALLALLIGKLMLITWGGTAELTKLNMTMLEEPTILKGLVRQRMMEEGAMDAELKAYLASDEFAEGEGKIPPALQDRYQAFEDQLKQRVESFPASERESIAKKMASEMMARIPIKERVMMAMSFFDILWFFLALGTAWRIGSGSGGGDD